MCGEAERRKTKSPMTLQNKIKNLQKTELEDRKNPSYQHYLPKESIANNAPTVDREVIEKTPKA